MRLSPAPRARPASPAPRESSPARDSPGAAFPRGRRHARSRSPASQTRRKTWGESNRLNPAQSRTAVAVGGDLSPPTSEETSEWRDTDELGHADTDGVPGSR